MCSSDLTALRARLADPSARVRFAAAQALGDLADSTSRDALVAALAANADTDVVLRFALARALARVASPADLATLATHPDRAVRLGAVLALREASAPELARFLADPDETIALETARAIQDQTVVAAYPSLAATLWQIGRAHV